MTQDPELVLSWGEPGEAPGQFSSPRHIEMDASGFVYVLDSGRVDRFDEDGKFVSRLSASGSFFQVIDTGWTYFLTGTVVVVYDPAGLQKASWDARHNVYIEVSSLDDFAVDDFGNCFMITRNPFLGFKMLKYAPDGRLLKTWTSGAAPWDGVETGKDGFLYTNIGNSVDRRTLEGSLVQRVFLAPPRYPKIQDVDSQGNFYSSDGKTITKYGPSGAILAEWDSPGGTEYPILSVASWDGRVVYVLDKGARKVFKYRFSTVASEATSWSSLKKKFRD